ncbi:hypothetical protein Q3V23_15135 [Streptomyces sp. VNUA116]|uniref:hypothetical protein n=1 Tax=Streptomyces sp. VNUA116 TaxID=3062449 RepID=UPI0026762D35|nr:hypothetical protein [Streptomyces sp. VNUA116]WKU45294.1 hypothetical protein Q3V23_15135 [Streptomyces sp. VNUA116]
MADADLSAAPRSPHPHPSAAPGYGKRTAPDQAPRRRGDFAHLRPREASIAAFIDRLPDGAAMDAKTLAAHLADYGQAACRTALRRLSEAGHLRRVTERIKGDSGSQHWVTRTYFSRTARDDAWWEAVLTSGVAPQPVEGRPAARPPRQGRSRAYLLLAGVGRIDPRMTLSAAECQALEGLVQEWLDLGADDEEVVRALTGGLPPEVHSAGALARRRLVDKMPPERAPEPSPRRPLRPLRILECTVCRTPGRPEALPGGLCRDCRGESRADQWPDPAVVRDRADGIRRLVRAASRATVPPSSS